MNLFSFCKRYLVKRFDKHINAYADEQAKNECRDLLLNSNDYRVLGETIVLCRSNELHSIANYNIVVKFCMYAVQTDFPYDTHSFDNEYVLDFIWIATSNKKTTTKAYYSNLIVSFVNGYNLNIHNDNRSIQFYTETCFYSTYLTFHQRLSDGEIRKILLELEHTNNDQFVVIIQILLRTGIRISELLHIKKKDIFCQDGMFFLRVKGKGCVYRMVSLQKAFFQRYYMSVVYPLGYEDFIFQTKNKSQLQRTQVYRKIEKFFSSLGIVKEKNGPHILRHTYASKLYEKHQDLILVQECLGHNNIETTKRYIHLRLSEFKKIADIYDDIVLETYSIFIVTVVSYSIKLQYFAFLIIM